MVTDAPKPAEMRLLRRVRSLTNGAHLCIIVIDVNGICTIAFIGNGKIEKVRRMTDEIERENPAQSQEHSQAQVEKRNT